LLIAEQATLRQRAMDAAARDTELHRDRGGTQLGAQLLDLRRVDHLARRNRVGERT
jgi:hypothetical protein